MLIWLSYINRCKNVAKSVFWDDPPSELSPINKSLFYYWEGIDDYNVINRIFVSATLSRGLWKDFDFHDFLCSLPIQNISSMLKKALFISILCMHFLCIYDCLTSIMHFINEMIQLFFVYCISCLTYNNAKSRIRHSFFIIFLNSVLHDISNDLNWIQIWRIRWSIYKTYIFFCKFSDCISSSVRISFVLHENKCKKLTRFDL